VLVQANLHHRCCGETQTVSSRTRSPVSWSISPSPMSSLLDFEHQIVIPRLRAFSWPVILRCARCIWTMRLIENQSFTPGRLHSDPTFSLKAPCSVSLLTRLSSAWSVIWWIGGFYSRSREYINHDVTWMKLSPVLPKSLVSDQASICVHRQSLLCRFGKSSPTPQQVCSHSHI